MPTGRLLPVVLEVQEVADFSRQPEAKAARIYF
jgi:hypothetical protein